MFWSLYYLLSVCYLYRSGFEINNIAIKERTKDEEKNTSDSEHIACPLSDYLNGLKLEV